MSEKIYEMVTNKIIEKLEAGTVPWRKPWVGKSGSARSWKTQKSYRGINTLLLEPGEYITFKQVQEAKGKVKKGAKSEIVVFWKWLEKENEEGETEKIPLLRFYKVFNINQCEGIESKWNEDIQEFEHDPIEEAENIIKGYMNKPSLSWQSGIGAFYQPGNDHVNVPPMKDFPKVEEYYCTMMHELIHSTGHKSRLNREGVTGTLKFGSQTYSKEELIAEIGATMLNGIAGFSEVTFDNSVAYIQSWLNKLKNDKTLIVKAAANAQRAVDHILGVSWDKDE
ncbi:DUF1738 domain-containing protein [Cytobacillus depressus]|uniref:DUF1738 domain-containing protein n=1 Tax=Cytobacillus depressus TaxID=1602942 RepID=A0A6L3V035_9BACI|nr:zincin-like metallopeptidase domain-containing protein [Cytobacillus depressus]KAB2328963.1 DUF1738 domain-containing protein [Cytobacillus depressus]